MAIRRSKTLGSSLHRNASNEGNEDLDQLDDGIEAVEGKPRKSLFGLEMSLDELAEMDPEAHKQAEAALLLTSGTDGQKMDDETVKAAGAFFGLSTMSPKKTQGNAAESKKNIQEAKRRAMAVVRTTNSLASGR